MHLPTEVRQILWLIFFVAVAAVLLDWLLLPLVDKYPSVHRVLEHVVLALYIGAVLGLTYELGLHWHRTASLRSILREFRTEAFGAIEAYAKLSPTDIFDLLRDIASRTNEIPTLYHPPRNEREYKFVQESKYFDKLLPACRPDIVEILRHWIQPANHRNVRFLASDLIGHYRLDELEQDLHELTKEPFENWAQLPTDERDCVLNYMWAVSRCEKKMYTTLGRLLSTSKDEYVQKWILFVPRQMPDKQFCGIIRTYLSTQTQLSSPCLKECVWALAALHAQGHSEVLSILRQFATRFAVAEVEHAWRHYHIDPAPILQSMGATHGGT